MATIPSTPKCDSCYNNNSGANEHLGGCSGCNTCNTTCQTLCQVGAQIMHEHPNVSQFPWGQVEAKKTIIKDILTASNWNNLISFLDAAENVGLIVSQGSAGSASEVSSGDVFTHNHYNEIAKKINGFDNASISLVNPQEVITAAAFNALRENYESAQFKNSVCDVCNTAQVTCSCNCPCSCNCWCTCPCPCPINEP